MGQLEELRGAPEEEAAEAEVEAEAEARRGRREQVEEQIATLRLQLHIADDELQQRRQSLSQSPLVQAITCAAPYEEFAPSVFEGVGGGHDAWPA